MSYMFPLQRHAESFYDVALDDVLVITVSFVANMAYNLTIFFLANGVHGYPLGPL